MMTGYVRLVDLVHSVLGMRSGIPDYDDRVRKTCRSSFVLRVFLDG